MTAQTVVAVTGAAGLVGSHVVEHLASQGFNVVAIARAITSDKEGVLSGLVARFPNVTLAYADIVDPIATKSALKGANVVVHAAGIVDPYGSREAIFATNVGGTLSALRCAKEVHASQFIHVSSLSVITGKGHQYNLADSAPLKLCGEAYADSKVEAEKLVMKEANKGAIAITIVRPGFIYGPRERAWMPRLIQSIATGKAMIIGDGTKETNVIYVGNLCLAIEAVIGNQTANGQIYNLTDGQSITKRQLFDAIADGMGLPRVTKKVPFIVAQAVCESISRVAPALPTSMQRNLARYSRAAFRLAALNQGFNITKAERELGYRNRIKFQDAMAATLQYFKEKGERKMARTS